MSDDPHQNKPAPYGAGFATAIAIAAFTVWAWADRFVLDDAFISFRYARNFAEGHGLVFNPGERVEGTTNFLWTFVLGLGMKLGLDPVSVSTTLGLGAFVGSLALVARLARAVTGSAGLGLLCVALLGSNATFRSFATGGLETSAQTFAMLGAMLIALETRRDARITWLRAVLLALSLVASLLMRLDSILLLFPVLVSLLPYPFARTKAVPLPVAKLLAAAGLAALIMGAWFAWKASFYGTLLPNTFAAKAMGSPEPKRGIYFIALFLASYGLLPAIGLIFASLGTASPNARHESGVRTGLTAGLTTRQATGPKTGPMTGVWTSGLASGVLLWVLYLLYIGGGYMEFRLLVPAMPLMTILAVDIVRRASVRREVWIAVSLLAVAGSAVHAHGFRGRRGISELRQPFENVRGTEGEWARIGRQLGTLFGEAEDPVWIATTAAGAIPYYSGLRTIDMAGLSDAWIARHGVRWGSRPGHRRMAPLSYLLERKVNLVLGHPLVLSDAELEASRIGAASRAEQVFLHFTKASELPDGAELVTIPLGSGRNVVAVYLTPHAAVDEAIRERGFNVEAIH